MSIPRTEFLGAPQPKHPTDILFFISGFNPLLSALLNLSTTHHPPVFHRVPVGYLLGSPHLPRCIASAAASGLGVMRQSEAVSGTGCRTGETLLSEIPSVCQRGTVISNLVVYPVFLVSKY